jgi:hypothetical protein
VPGGKPVWYQKHMTHHMIPGFGREWLGQVRNAFLIRDPAAVLASYVAKRGDVTMADIGIVQQHELFEQERNGSGRRRRWSRGRTSSRDPARALGRSAKPSASPTTRPCCAGRRGGARATACGRRLVRRGRAVDRVRRAAAREAVSLGADLQRIAKRPGRTTKRSRGTSSARPPRGSRLIERLARRLPFYYGWVVVGVVFVTMAICVNARTAFSLLFPPILDEFGWERGVTAGAFSFGFIVSAVLSPLLGRLMDRRGPRFVMEIGVAATAAGLLLATFASEPWHVYLTLGMLVGAGTTFTGYTGQALFLPNWFVRRRGLAMSIAFAGVGFGSIVLLPALQTFVERHGWRAGARCWACWRSSSSCRSTCCSGGGPRRSAWRRTETPTRPRRRRPGG